VNSSTRSSAPTASGKPSAGARVALGYLAATAPRDLVVARLARRHPHDLELDHHAVVLVIEHVAVDHVFAGEVAEVG
jgi:hypothetical protein